MTSFFGMVLASMIYELRKEVLAHFLQRIFFENDYHFHFDFEKDSQYHTHTQKKPLKKRFKKIGDNRKVYEVKGVLMLGVLVRYRCACFGMVLALIHPYKQEDFNTLKTHIQSLFS